MTTEDDNRKENKPRRDLRESGNGKSDDERDTDNKPRKRLDRDD